MRINPRKFSMGTALTGVMIAAGLAVATPAQAAETIKLTAMDGYSPKSMWVKTFIDYFIPEVDKRLAAEGKYKIQWNQAWGQIVKPRGVLGGLQKGLGDIGVVTTVFHSDKVPMQMVAYATPFVTNDPVLVSKTVDGLADEIPAFKGTFDKFNLHYLTSVAVFDTYQIFSKEPISSLEDLRGLKIGSAGLNLRWLEGFGAAGVAGSLVSYYNKLKTGVLDAIMLWPEAVVGRKMYEVAPYMLKADLGTANSKVIAVNADTWKKLPGSVQAAIQEVAIGYRDHTSTMALDVAKASLAAYVEGGGKITELSQAERVKWAKSMPNVAKTWAASLDSKGLPGSEVLTSYMNTMRAANQPIIRQWDKE